MTTGKV